MKNWKVMSNASDGGIDTFVGFTDERWGDELVCYLYNGPSKICDDRAHLIAAAPDMYEALQAALTALRDMYDAMENGVDVDGLLENAEHWPLTKIRAALAKATGK